jgi:outer membrane biosynthesis protein TonB
MDITATERPVNVKATAWTVGVHVLLLLLFVLIKYSSPAVVNNTVEMGMEVNLGTSDDGSGTDQPMAIENPSPDQASVSYRTSTAENVQSKDLMESDDVNAPEVNAPSINKSNGRSNAQSNSRSRTDQQARTNNTTRPQRPRYVYKGGTGSGGNSASTDAAGTSEGNTTGKGDRGVPSGTPGATNYSGVPGSGNGISHNIAGRSIIAFPPPEASFKEGGRVTIRVTVNKAGIITNKQIVSASNAELKGIALRKVDKIKFNKSDEAPEEQFGNITFVFKTRS